jgi:hypothetical protein
MKKTKSPLNPLIRCLLIVSVISIRILGQNCIPAPSGLVSWWPFDDNPSDIRGSNPMLLLGEPSYAAAKVADGLEFSDCLFAVAKASTSLDVGNGNGFTIDAWINPSDISTKQPVFEWGSGECRLGVHFWISHEWSGADVPGALYANLVDTSNGQHVIQTPGNLLSANALQLVALTYDKTTQTAKLYLNGLVVKTEILGLFTPNTSGNLYFGFRMTQPLHFLGVLDEVELFNRALSGSEVQAIYNAGSAGMCK